MHLLFHAAKVPSGVTFPLGVVKQASKQIDTPISKKSPTVGPTKKRTPKKPEYLLARSKFIDRGPLGFGPIQFLMEYHKNIYTHICTHI